jgi:hypothetical protein
MQKILLAGLVVVVGTLVIVRTSIHRPAWSEPVARIEIAIDKQLPAKHLSEIVQIRTVAARSDVPIIRLGWSG